MKEKVGGSKRDLILKLKLIRCMNMYNYYNYIYTFFIKV